MCNKFRYFAFIMKNLQKTHFLVLSVISCYFLMGYAQKDSKGKVIKGVASYYADRFHGRTMANGEPYNRDSFTCAHLRYPFGTKLKVRNPVNKKECLVEVTDRGPYSKKFTIDLSRAAATYLEVIGRGYIAVEITPYYSGTVPYALGPIEYPELPELAISFEPAATYPYPAWRKDSTKAKSTKEPKLQLPLKKKHR